jgi:23S rRNA pseudouridine1911/1915/1917 synthase
MIDTATHVEKVAVEPAEAGERIDRLLAARLEALSRSRLKALILDGRVELASAAGARTIRDPGHRVNAGDAIAVSLPPPKPATPAGEPIALSVLYEDAAIIVIDKPAGLVVHPAAGHPGGTLVNALIAHCGDSLSGIGGVMRPGIVHRLDKDTSGVMVVAKNDRAHKALAAQFADHGRTGPLARSYLAFVWGVPDRPRGTIDAPIERHPHARDKMAVRKNGRFAITHWELVECYRGASGRPVASLIACALETGRTHQIRVHLAHIGHPLLGDTVYGPGFRTKTALLGTEAAGAVSHLERQALHAHMLGIQHPHTREYLEFRSELPADLGRLRHALAAGGIIDQFAASH